MSSYARSHLQLIAILFLCSETLWLLFDLILGILGAILGFLWESAQQVLQFICTTGFPILLFWIFLAKYASNHKILGYLRRQMGQKNLSRLLVCENCKKPGSCIVFEKCCHCFHEECMPLAKDYLQWDLCPSCLQNKKQKKNPHILAKMMWHIPIRQVTSLFPLIVVAALYGLYRYLQTYWGVGGIAFSVDAGQLGEPK